MASDPQLFRINPTNKESQRIQEVDFTQLGFKERRDIQEWVAANPSILGEDLLVISKEFSGFDKTNERLDLLAVDSDGMLVIIELKRDDTGADAHWQAIKYASYLQSANVSDVIEMLAAYEGISQEEATNKLLEHLGDIGFSALNNDQRIILASHRFAPEVTSAALWLNQKAPGENLITCVRLTPYQDSETNSLYVQASTIIPVPGADQYLVGIGNGSQAGASVGISSIGEKLRRRFQQNKGDDVTSFAKRVASLALDGMPTDIRPDKVSRWAGGWEQFRYLNFWYNRPPWKAYSLCYRISFRPGDEPNTYLVYVRFLDEKNSYGTALKDIGLNKGETFDNIGIVSEIGTEPLSDEFAQQIAETLGAFIEGITPRVDELQDEGNEETA